MRTRCVLFLLLAGAAANAAADRVILDEPFNYSGQAALNAAWNANAPNDPYPTYFLDTGAGKPAASYHMASPQANMTGLRLARNLGGTVNGTDTRPLTFSFDMCLADPSSDYWNGARDFVDLRGYSGGGFGNGDLQSLLAVGVYNTTDQNGQSFNTKWYNARIAFPADGSSLGWGCLETNGGGPVRSGASGNWHELKAIVRSAAIDFYVDNVLAQTRPRPTTVYGFDSIVLGSGLTANGYTALVDNIHVSIATVNFPGDANWDGTVDIADLSILLANFDKTGMTWASGDFNADGSVDIVDLSNLLTNFDKTAVASAPSIAAVPEPSSAVLVVITAVGLLRRRAKRARRTASFGCYQTECLIQSAGMPMQ
jgi:hypothetical protein